MSTRANIAIVLRDEDLNKDLNFTDYQKSKEIVPADAIKEYDESVYSSNKVLQIYCHHDGYISGLGEELFNNFNTYEDVLALVLAGDTSWVDDGKSGIYALIEGYERCMPKVIGEPKMNELFLYVFKDNEWHVYSASNECKDSDILASYIEHN